MDNLTLGTPGYRFEPRTERPKLHHPELKQLYELEYFDERTDDFGRWMGSLPEATLLEDAQAVFADFFHRWHLYAPRLKELEPHELAFGWKAYQLWERVGLWNNPDLLYNALRQSQEALDFLWGDHLHGEFPFELVNAVQRPRLPAAFAFMREIGVSPWAKVANIKVLIDPSHDGEADRQMVIGHVRELFEFYLSEAGAEADAHIVVTSLIVEAFLLGWPALGDYVRRCDAAGLVDYFVSGDADELLAEHEQALQHFADYQRNEAAQQTETFRNYYEERQREAAMKLLKSHQLSPPPLAPSTPVVRTGKKVGRNDPCPCGSGKKYKKCCLNK